MTVKNPINIDTPESRRAVLRDALDNHAVFYKILRQLDACKNGKRFVRKGRLTLRQAWNTCNDPTFMSWWLAQLPSAENENEPFFGMSRHRLVAYVREVIDGGLLTIHRRYRLAYRNRILAAAFRAKFTARGNLR